MRIFNIVFILLFIFGCDGKNSSTQTQTLSVIAGSELKDIEPKLKDIEKQVGIKLNFTYIGTLDGADKIVSGEKYDFGWFSHSKYLNLLQKDKKYILSSEPIGLSPVILGVKKQKAKSWGWLDKKVSWQEIAKKAKSKELRYAMTDPTASNTGFSTVIGIQSAFNNSSDAFTAKTVDSEKLQDFFSGQGLTSGSSGWLVEAYKKDEDVLDGLFNYESVLLALNKEHSLKEDLVLIYPKEGVVTADYPLLLLNKDVREAYRKLVTYFKTDEFQKWMMAKTNRRPVIPTIKLDDKFPKNYLMELPFPAKLETVNAMLFSFLDKQKKPNTALFVLDISGSMREKGRLKALKKALINLTGKDSSITGQFARFRDREKVILIPFDHMVQNPTTIEVSLSDNSLQEIYSYAQNLDSSGGGTAIYDSIIQAYNVAYNLRKKDPERLYSIVLMTDGENHHGSDLSDFKFYYDKNVQHLRGIRVFPILFENSNDEEMKSIAHITGGRIFDARKASLAHAFKKIRGYQ